MGTIMIRCPGTGRAVPTGIELERATFDQLPNVPSGLTCPACGGYHAWTKNEAWLSEEAITGIGRELS